MGRLPWFQNCEFVITLIFKDGEIYMEFGVEYCACRVGAYFSFFFGGVFAIPLDFFFLKIF